MKIEAINLEQYESKLKRKYFKFIYANTIVRVGQESHLEPTMTL